jgi:hypothetical protein
LHVVAGVQPGVPVVFDTSSPDRVVLRPAGKRETTNETRPVYRFEWQTDGTARFYELADPKVLERLSRQNAESTTSAEGRRYESKVIDTFFSGSKVLQACLPPDKSFHGTITAFIVVGKDGKQEEALVLPEGSVAECITRATATRTYPSPPRPFTAKAEIRVTEEGQAGPPTR